MTALSNLSDVINRLTGGSSGAPEHIYFYKDAYTMAGTAVNATVIGRLTSLWEYSGVPSGGEVPPTSATVPTNSTAGALKQTNPGGSAEKWLIGFDATALTAGNLILYDRLLHISGLSGTVTTAQTVGGSLSRYTDGAGNIIIVEIYTTVGTSGTTITASYTNQAGTSGKTTVATTFGGTGFRETQRAIILPLAAGDTGVQAVASVTLAASTGTAGNFGIVIAHPLDSIQVPAPGVGAFKDFISGLPSRQEVKSNASLALLWLAGSTTAPQIVGKVDFVES